MSLLGRTAFKTVAGKRFFSAAVSPKTAIAQNIMLLREIASAADEAALTKITSQGLPKISITATPKELEELKSYLLLSELGSSEKYVADPTAWQNMSFGGSAAAELQRSETWPFAVGFLVTFLLLGVGLAAALPKNGDARKNSKYMQMLEGRAHGEHAEVAHH